MSRTVGLTGEFDLMRRSALNQSFTQASATPQTTLLQSLGYKSAYTGANTASQSVSVDRTGANQLSQDQSSQVRNVAADAQNYIQQVGAFLKDFVQEIKQAAEDGGVEFGQAFPMGMGDSGSMAVNVGTAIVGGGDSISMVSDLVAQLKQDKCSPKEAQAIIADKIQEKASANPVNMTPAEKESQQTCQVLAKAIDNGSDMSELVRAAEDPSILPEVREAQTTAQQANKTHEGLQKTIDDTAERAQLTSAQDALVKDVSGELAAKSINVKDAADAVDSISASSQGDVLASINWKMNGQATGEFLETLTVSFNSIASVKEAQELAMKQVAEAQVKYDPPTQAFAGASMGGSMMS